MDPREPDPYARAPGAPAPYDMLDAEIIPRGGGWCIPEVVQRVTRSKTPAPNSMVRFQQVDMHHPPVLPMQATNPTVELRCTAEHSGNEPK